MADGRCEDCNSAGARVSLDGVVLCDRCADRRIARATGHPELPEPPLPIVVAGPDGRRHTLAFRVWRAPTGIEVELEETGVPRGEGFHFAVLGAHDADVDALAAHVRRRAEDEIRRPYLEPDPHRPGSRVHGDEVVGRLVWSDERVAGGSYDVIVDGRTLTWNAFGHALQAFEGWRFRLVIEDRCDDLRPDAAVIHLTKAAAAVPDDLARPSIARVLDEFLTEQKKRLAPSTYRKYEEVVLLLRDFLNNYGHQSLSTSERERFEAGYDHDEGAFVHLFGPDKIAENLGEFLGDFMVRKVMGGEELLRASGAVTKKLAKWLGERGYLATTAVAIAVERGGDAARDLPKAEKLSRLLFEQAKPSTADPDSLAEQDYVEDYLVIDRVEPGVLWFEGGVGPVKVSKKASDLAQAGWSVSISLGRVRGSWQIFEVGNVYP